MLYRWIGLTVLIVTISACNGREDEAPAVESEEEVAVTQPAPAAEPVAAEEPEVTELSKSGLPEGFPDNVPFIEGFKVESAEIVDAASKQFKIVGLAPVDEVDLMEWYAAKWTELGWEEDMLMEQHGNTIVSYIKDGLLVVVDSVPAPGGSRATITTGSV